MAIAKNFTASLELLQIQAALIATEPVVGLIWNGEIIAGKIPEACTFSAISGSALTSALFSGLPLKEAYEQDISYMTGKAKGLTYA